MNKNLPFALAFAVLGLTANGQNFVELSIPEGKAFGKKTESSYCLTETERQTIKQTLETQRLQLIADGKLNHTKSTVSFSWPLKLADGIQDYGYHSISGFVDHNAAYPDQLLDYNCGSRTYDVSNGNNHKGTDYYLWPFEWNKMANDEVEVIAAAPGTILYKEDGHSDQNCSLNGSTWNAIYIEHSDGSQAWYGHFKNGSLTAKNVGETVAAGEFLGVVGSSGSSSGPHLHFEVYDSNDNLIDPYQGNCNSMNTNSWWQSQHAYNDAALNRLATNSSPPVFNDCPQLTVTNEATEFAPGDSVYLVSYYRNLTPGDQITVTVKRPNGSTHTHFTWTCNFPQFYTSAYAYWYIFPDSYYGEWNYEVAYMGETYSTTFNIGASTDIPDERLKVFSVYPNPSADGVFKLDATGQGKAIIQITDLCGRQVYQMGGNIPKQINLQGMSNGTYLMKLKVGERWFTEKLMIGGKN